MVGGEQERVGSQKPNEENVSRRNAADGLSKFAGDLTRTMSVVW